jgi:predicted nucleic acid-binding protein
MNYKYVLDSYAWAEFFDGTEKGKKVKELIEQRNIASSIIVLAELSDKCARENRELELFIKFIDASSAILSLSKEIAVNSGKLKTELRKISKNVSLADAIHFQTAKSVNATFVTGDPDFREIKEKDILFL